MLRNALELLAQLLQQQEADKGDSMIWSNTIISQQVVKFFFFYKSFRIVVSLINLRRSDVNLITACHFSNYKI